MGRRAGIGPVGCTIRVVRVHQLDGSQLAREVGFPSVRGAGQKARTCAWGRACASAIGMMAGRRRFWRPIKLSADPSKRHGAPKAGAETRAAWFASHDVVTGRELEVSTSPSKQGARARPSTGETG